jgi:CzcA family heavy metal efflux pump
MNASEWMAGHRKSILFLLAVLIVAGGVSSIRMPASLFPRIDFPRVRVELDAGDRPASQMGMEVTWPVEEAVRSVPGVRTIRSTTSRGSADISVNFDWGQDMITAALQVQSAISQIVGTLPQGTTFNVRRMDPTVFPVLGYSLSSDVKSSVNLRDTALYQIRPRLSTVPGVATVGVQGGDTEEYHVTVDPLKLASYGMSLDDVSKALSASNVIEAIGRLEDHYKLYLVVSDTRLLTLAEIGETVLRSGENGVVTLNDIAIISKGIMPQWTRVTADGRDAVLFQVYQQPGSNTVSIAQGLKATLDAFRKQLAASTKIGNWYDQSELIVSSVSSVRDAILIGVVLAALILLVFLRSFKITLIAVITVPAVLAATVMLLYVFHMSFNIMTLGGMAAAVGLIIDDTVVMVEHIIRRHRDETRQGAGKGLAAAQELAKPLVGSSASTIIIFVPLAFLSGVTGAFFKALSLTMALSLIISFFVARLAVPLLADHLLRREEETGEKEGRLNIWFRLGYERLMARALNRRFYVLVLLLVLVAAGWFSYRHIGSGFMPPMDEGGFILDYWAPPGTSLTESDRLLKQVEAIIQATPEVETYSRRTGLQLGGGVTEANQGDFFIKLKPFPRRPIEQVMDDVRTKVEHSIPGLEIELAQLMEDLIGDLAGTPQPIEVKLYSDDEVLLKRLGPVVAHAIETVPGVVDVKDGIVIAGDALDVRVDRVKASREGVDPDVVTRMALDYLTGTVTTQIQQDPKMIGVRVQIPHEMRATANDIENLRLHTPDGHYFPIKRVAALTFITGQPEITREDLKRMVAVTGRISGRDLGSVIREVKSALNRPGLMPPGVYYSLGGLYEQQQAAFAGLITVFGAAVLLVFLLLLFFYESFPIALAIIATTLLSVAAVFIGLAVTSTELNISSMMGMTMIIGIVTETAIFYVSEYEDIRTKGKSQHGELIRAGANRMRPIVMTTLATILALGPLAIALGRGSAMQQPLAIAIISGLVVQLPLVLIVLPVLLTLGRKT